MGVNDSSAGARNLGATSAAPGSVALRQLARRVLARRAGGANGTNANGVESLVAAANRAYDDLVLASAPVIGQTGVDALIGRAVHLAQREFPWLPTAATRDRLGGSFADVLASLQKQDLAVATDATAAVFATFAGLLIIFIGESLTAHLLDRAWPDAARDRTQRSRER
jgi:hypothetical protein